MNFKFLILYLKVLLTKTEILNENFNITKQEINNDILEVIYEEFKYDNCLIIAHKNTATELFQFINSKTIIDISSTEIISQEIKYNAYIIIIDTINDINSYFDAIQTNIDKKAKYLVVSKYQIDTVIIFEKAIENGILNVNILINNEIFTYFPYSDGKCGNNSQAVKVCIDANSSLMQRKSSLYPDKIPRDLKGCPIKLTGVKIIPYVLDITAEKDNPRTAGLEVTIIYNIFKKMNFTQIYVPNTYPHWGYMLPDGNFTMTYKSLKAKKVDIIFGMMIGNRTMSKHFDVTYPHIDTTAVWFVPVALPIAQWKNLTVIFDGIVWTAILLVVLSNGFAWFILGRKNESAFNELSLCLMGAFYILLQGSVVTPRTWKLRFVVIIWSVSSLLLFTAHQCQLTGILTSPIYDHQISTLNEMVHSHLDYGFYPILKSLYKESNNVAHKKLLKYYKPCPLTTECMNRTAFKRDFATIKNKREASFLMSKYYSFPSGKPMLYSFEESEFVVWCKYYVEKGFPFLERINEKILMLQAGGLISKWEHNLVDGINNRVEVSELQSLTVNHLQGAFFLLLIGNFLAFFVFVYEKIKFRMKQYKKDKNVIEELEVNNAYIFTDQI